MTNLTAFWQDPIDGGGGGPALPTIMWDADAITGTSGWFTSEMPIGSTANATGTWTDDDASALEPVDEIWIEMDGRVRGGVVSPVNGDAAFDLTSGVWSYSESSFKLIDEGKPIFAKIRDFNANEAESEAVFYWNHQDPLQTVNNLQGSFHPYPRSPSTGNDWEHGSVYRAVWVDDDESTQYQLTTTGYGGHTKIGSLPYPGTLHTIEATTANGYAGQACEPRFCMAIPDGRTVNFEVTRVLVDTSVVQNTYTVEGPLNFSGKPDELNITLPPVDLEDGDTLTIAIWLDPGSTSPEDLAVWQYSDHRIISQVEAAKTPEDVVDANGIFVDPVAGVDPTNTTDFLSRIGNPAAPIRSHNSWGTDAYQNLMAAGTYNIYQKRGTIADQGKTWNAVFPGSNNHVNLNQVLVGATENFEIQIDVNPDGYPASGEWAVFSQYSSGTAGRLMLSILANGKARFFIENGGAPNNITIDSPEAIPIGEWTTLGIHRSNDKFNLTVNRVDVGEQTESGVSVQTSKFTMICNDDANLNDFDGRMRAITIIVGSPPPTTTQMITNTSQWIGGVSVVGSITTEQVAAGDSLVMKGYVTSGANLGDRKSFHVKPWPYSYGAKPIIECNNLFPTSSQNYGVGQVGAITFRNCINSSIEGFIVRNSKQCGICAEVDTVTTTCDNITVTDCVVQRSASDAMLFEGLQTNHPNFADYPVTNVHVSNCGILEANYAMQLNPNHIAGHTDRIEGKTGQALTFVHATDCTVSNCWAINYNKEGFDAISSRRITFTDLFAKQNPDSIYGTQRGTAYYSDSQGEGSEDITFDRCICAGDTAGVVIASEAGGDIIRVVARNCVVYNTTSSGLIFSDEGNTGVVVRDSGFEHCTVDAGNQFALRSTLGSPNLTADDMFVRHCVLKSNLQTVMASDHGFTNWLIDRNLWYSTGGPVTSEKGTNALEGDPLYISATDLRLGVGSPGLDAIPNGNIIRTLNVEGEFVTPPDGSGPDNMGAY